MRRNGLTLVELLVIVGVFAICLALLFPHRHHNRQGALRASCQSNLKQIALAVIQYSQDSDEKYPLAKNSDKGVSAPDNWAGQLQPYSKSAQLFQCYSDENANDRDKCSYAFNARLSRADNRNLNFPAFAVLNFEVVADENNWTQTGNSPKDVSASERHLEGANFSFADGHVKWCKPGKVTDAKPDGKNLTFRADFFAARETSPVKNFEKGKR